MTSEQQIKSRVDELIAETFGQSLAPIKAIGAMGVVMCVILAIAVTYAYLNTPAVDFIEMKGRSGDVRLDSKGLFLSALLVFQAATSAMLLYVAQTWRPFEERSELAQRWYRFAFTTYPQMNMKRLFQVIFAGFFLFQCLIFGIGLYHATYVLKLSQAF
jgi:hypothetical protein